MKPRRLTLVAVIGSLIAWAAFGAPVPVTPDMADTLGRIGIHAGW